MEQLDIVDEHDVVIGQVPRDTVYEQNELHRIVHVFIVHPHTKKIYLQRRAAHLPYMPNRWCSSAAGHVQSGESYDQAAIRELAEEVGITTTLTPIGKILFTLDNHSLFIANYIGYAVDGFSFVDGEVSEGETFTVEEIQRIIDTDRDNNEIHPQLGPCFAVLKEYVQGNKQHQ